jgi:ribose 1,5-bisphosphokinase PhnN
MFESSRDGGDSAAEAPMDGAAPGAALAADLAATELRALPDDALVDVIRGWERVVSWAQAEQLAAVAEFARRRPAGPDAPGSASGVSEFAVDEVASALRLSRPAAGVRLQVAVELASRLPDAAAALRRGEIDLPKARAVVDAVAPLDVPAAAAVAARVLPRAGRQTVGQLRASLARAVLSADPAAAQLRHERAVADRRVIHTPLPDGMGELCAVLPADAASAAYAAIDARARSGPHGDRSMDARRADALVALLTGAAPTPSGPLVQVTVPAATLLGLGEAPGELAGHGPIPASMARRIAAVPTGTWRRILTDSNTGAVLDVGRTTYRPPPAIARHVTARDGTCRFPGCRQPARRCDLDHVQPYPAGPTAAANLMTLCRHHHRLKHAGRWRVAQAGNGTVTWTSPTGHRYTTEPQHVGEDGQDANDAAGRVGVPAAATRGPAQKRSERRRDPASRRRRRSAGRRAPDPGADRSPSTIPRADFRHVTHRPAARLRAEPTANRAPGPPGPPAAAGSVPCRPPMSRSDLGDRGSADTGQAAGCQPTSPAATGPAP